MEEASGVDARKNSINLEGIVSSAIRPVVWIHEKTASIRIKARGNGFERSCS